MVLFKGQVTICEFQVLVTLVSNQASLVTVDRAPTM